MNPGPEVLYHESSCEENSGGDAAAQDPSMVLLMFLVVSLDRFPSFQLLMKKPSRFDAEHSSGFG